MPPSSWAADVLSDDGPLGPGVVGAALLRRLREKLKLVYNLRALAVGRAQAVGARIAAAEDDDPLALGRDGVLRS